MSDISTKGLDDFSTRFLSRDRPGEQEIVVTKGSAAKPEALKRYEEQRKEEFIKRAATFTEDVIAFIIDERQKRGLSDAETVFGIALACINLRNAYGNPQSDEEVKAFNSEKQAALLSEFDEICYHAQQYWDNNT